MRSRLDAADLRLGLGERLADRLHQRLDGGLALLQRLCGILLLAAPGARAPAAGTPRCCSCSVSRASSPNTPWSCSRVRSARLFALGASDSSVLTADAQHSGLHAQALFAPRRATAALPSMPSSNPTASAVRLPRCTPAFTAAPLRSSQASRSSGRADGAVRRPRPPVVVGVQSSRRGDQRRHAGGVRRLNVALGIAHIDALAGRRRRPVPPHAASAAGAACARAQRVAAHHAGEARPQSELLEQRLGEPRRLVGDDAGHQAARGERVEHLVHAVEQARLEAEARRGRCPGSAAASAANCVRVRSGKTEPHHGAPRRGSPPGGPRRRAAARGRCSARSALSAPTMSGAVSSSVPSRSNSIARSGASRQASLRRKWAR